MMRWLAAGLLGLLATGCSDDAATKGETPADSAADAATAGATAAAPKTQPVPVAVTARRVAVQPVDGATPMAERRAMVGLLNKRNGTTVTLTMRPGQAVRVDKAVVRLRACEQTPPWERPRETGAFVQLLVKDVRADNYRRVFSGWLFRERPERNVVQHPVYDVFVKACEMSWPGMGPAAPDDAAGAASRSNADQSAGANGGRGDPQRDGGPTA